MNKNKLSYYKKKAWKLFSEYIRRKYASNDGNVVCVSCGKILPWKESQAGHFIPTGTGGNSIRFVEDNVHPQCYRCNCLQPEVAMIEYFLFMEKKYGRERIEDLRKLKKETRKIPQEEYLQMIETYTKKLKELDNGR